MIQYLNVFFYDIYPYICATVFSSAAGCATTTGSTPGAPPQVKCSITRDGDMVESVPYRHFGDFLRALVRHVTPHWMYAWFLPVAAKQLMAMVLGGICGVLTLIGGAGLLWRRLTNQRVRATSTTPDIIIMSIC
ncbi:respiratory nitrate reductase 2 gamma chain [Escherichia coli]|nr:respiratory nitrate reductase 2 gamma chain [Escherichia coli]